MSILLKYGIDNSIISGTIKEKLLDIKIKCYI